MYYTTALELGSSIGKGLFPAFSPGEGQSACESRRQADLLTCGHSISSTQKGFPLRAHSSLKFYYCCLAVIKFEHGFCKG